MNCVYDEVVRKKLPHINVRLLVGVAIVLTAAAAALAFGPDWLPRVGVALAILVAGALSFVFYRAWRRREQRMHEASLAAAAAAHEKLREERRREVILLDKIDTRTQDMADRLDSLQCKLTDTETNLVLSQEKLAQTEAALAQSEESLAERTGQMNNMAEALLRYEAELARARIFADEADIVELADRRSAKSELPAAKEA